jgi:hypothetical protein
LRACDLGSGHADPAYREAAAGGGSAARVGVVKALLDAGAGRQGGARAALERARDAREADLIALLSQPRWHEGGGGEGEGAGDSDL